MNQRQMDPWREHLFRPLVIGIMVGCVAWPVANLAYMFFPVWNPAYLTLSCVLAVLEASYSYRLLQSRRRLRSGVLKFRVVELLVIFLLLKIGSYLGKGWADVLAEIRTWPRDPGTIFDPQTAYAFVLAFAFWSATTLTLHDLERLGEPPERHPAYVPPMESLATRFFWGGVVLLITVGLARATMFKMLKPSRPPVPGLLLTTLVYFMLGLVMLGQVHLAGLRKRWRAQEIKVADDLARRWARYSLTFIGLAALLAFLLPTGYTVGLLEVAGLAITFVAQILSAVALLIFALLTLPLQLLLWLLSMLFGTSRSLPQFKLPKLELVPPAPSESGGTLDWFAILRSLLFWAVMLGVVFYVVRSYLRDHPELWEALVTLGPVQTLRRGWAALRRWLRRWLARVRRTVGERLPRRLARRLPGSELPGVPWRFFRLGVLSPRERVLYYYLSILRRAGKQGFPRRRAQTPREYYEALEPNLPQAQGEMEALTQAFVEARYSQHEVESEQDRRVRAHWERIKAALRALKRRQEPEE